MKLFFRKLYRKIRILFGLSVLTAEYTLETRAELQQEHGIDLEKHLIECLRKELEAESYE